MSVKFYVSSSVRCVNEIDIRDTNSCIIRAILFPESPSAFRSCQLIKEEKSVPIQVRVQKRLLPSPDNTFGEEDSSHDEAEKGSEEAESDRGPGTTQRRRAGTSDSPARRPVILLIQPPGLQRFTFGSSPENDIVLKINETEEEGCYVNLWHCRIYPDPDSDAVLLNNLSSSIFSIQYLKSGAKISIAPSHDVFIEHGTWRLTLGKGLCFQIRVLPRPSPEEDGCTWSLLSSYERPPKTHSYAANTRTKEEPMSSPAAIEFIEMASKRTNARSALTSRDRSSSRTKRTASQIHQSAVPATAHGENLGSQKSGNSTRGIKATTSVLAATLATKVFRVSRPDGTVFVAKVCRHPDLKLAADTWKREATILQELDHRYIVKLLGLDALRLTLRLEYISGISVDQFINDDLVSTVPESRRFCIWSNISDAITYIHGQEILHNDIKPANIILGPSSRGAVLCDFGVATSSTEHISGGGTASFIAPECLWGWEERSFPSDIWAFGVTMLFVTGHIPRPQGDWCITNITKKTKARQDFMSWLALLQTAIGRIPERLQLMRDMLRFEREHRIKAETLSEQVRTLAQQQAEHYSQQDRLLLPA